MTLSSRSHDVPGQPLGQCWCRMHAWQHVLLLLLLVVGLVLLLHLHVLLLLRLLL